MGKSSAPAAPDYVGQANAQAAGNLNAARAQTAANRINQVTPYGSIKYTQGGGQFDQHGFDEALGRYQNQQEQIRNNAGLQEYYGKTGQLLTNPNRSDFMQSPDEWSSEIELSDTGKQLLDAYNRTSLGMADLQGGAMDRVRSSLSQPFDMSGIPDQVYGIDGNNGLWDKYSGLLQQQMNPEFDRQQAALDTKLANQGLTAGSEGWGTQQQQFGKQRSDAALSAQLQGANLAMQNAQMSNQGRQQELTTRATLRQMPLQELNALRSGSQVTNPTFSTPGQQGQTSGPDLLGATGQQYNAQVGQVNAQNAQSASNTQAGVGALAALAYFY